MKIAGPINSEPIHDVAHLAFAELFTPVVVESVAFFENILGMDVVERTAGSVFLRAFEDPYRYSLKLTSSPRPGSGVASFRTTSAAALQRRADALAESGLGKGWEAPTFGKGRTYRFATPDGHQMELVWDVERVRITESNSSLILNRPTRRPNRGVPVRRLDHINYMAQDPDACAVALMDHLGFKLTEQVVDSADRARAAWLRVSALTHDVAFMQDQSTSTGRLHHLAFWYSSPQYLMDVAELCLDHGYEIDAGPGKHGPSQAHYLYVKEPGGNRIELFGDVGFLIFDPSWQPVTWRDGDVGRKGFGFELSAEFYRRATPEA
jgi:catechol 2,3-dioxygenase